MIEDRLARGRVGGMASDGGGGRICVEEMLTPGGALFIYLFDIIVFSVG